MKTKQNEMKNQGNIKEVRTKFWKKKWSVFFCTNGQSVEDNQAIFVLP